MTKKTLRDRREYTKLMIEVYGPAMNIESLARAFNVTPGTMSNKISDGTCSVPTFLERGIRMADTTIVAEYFFDRREQSKTEFLKEQAKLAS